MSSEQQIAANQRNAKKSTGPRSAAGKARSRQNALKHGLTAQCVLLPNEDPAEYKRLRQALFDRFSPKDALEVHLVERLASLVWRLQRAPAFEVALIEWKKHDQARKDDGLDALFDKRRPLLSGTFTDSDDEGSVTQEVLDIGRTLEALLKTDLTSKLSRYETGLQHQLSATLKELRELQANRQDPAKLIDAAE